MNLVRTRGLLWRPNLRIRVYKEAIDLFRRMLSLGVRPDDATMIAVVAACTELGALDVGKWVGSYVEKEKVEKGVHFCNALIDMFSKCGDVDQAMKLFRSTNEGERTIVSWTCVIVGLAMHGRGVDAVAFFEEMIRKVMDKKGMKKVPGSTMIMLDEEICRFEAGDGCHNQ